MTPFKEGSTPSGRESKFPGVPTATMARWRIDGEDWMKEIKRSPSGIVARSMMQAPRKANRCHTGPRVFGSRARKKLLLVIDWRRYAVKRPGFGFLVVMRQVAGALTLAPCAFAPATVDDALRRKQLLQLAC